VGKRYRIVVVLGETDEFPGGEPLTLEFTAPSAEEAYAQLNAQMSPLVVWDSQNDWYEDGVPMSYDAIEDARVAFFKKQRETEPCSFCHSTGFVGTNLCQECRSAGVRDV
jgi:hypothetical protein